MIMYVEKVQVMRTQRLGGDETFLEQRHTY